jgi:hypothetical protein
MYTMLILRGNPGLYANEAGKSFNYTGGALHETAALEYATLVGFKGEVLNVVGWAAEDSEQTKQALAAFRSRLEIRAFYGFSGGGYNVKHILDKLTPDEYERVLRVVVLGAPKNRPEKYQASTYGGKANWVLVYKFDPEDAKGGHMFGPDELLKETEAQVRKERVRFSPTRTRGHH